jgi:hypothetical protein
MPQLEMMVNCGIGPVQLGMTGSAVQVALE